MSEQKEMLEAHKLLQKQVSGQQQQIEEQLNLLISKVTGNASKDSSPLYDKYMGGNVPLPPPKKESINLPKATPKRTTLKMPDRYSSSDWWSNIKSVFCGMFINLNTLPYVAGFKIVPHELTEISDAYLGRSVILNRIAGHLIFNAAWSILVTVIYMYQVSNNLYFFSGRYKGVFTR